MAEIVWGILLVAYLFVGGMAGGSYVVSALADFFGKGKYRLLSKSGTYVSLISILIGLILLILDLGRFTVDPLIPLNAYINFPTSIMSVGTWVVTGFMVVSLLTSVLWFFNGNSAVRKLLQVVGLVLGGSTMTYTGLLLSFSRPFWRTPYLPWLFIISGSLTGLAIALFMIPIIAVLIPRFFEEFKELFMNKKEFVALLSTGQRYIVALIIVELGLVAVELTAGNVYAEYQLAGLSAIFLIYVVFGLIIPLGIGYYIGKEPSMKNEKTAIMLSLVGFVLILAGGFLLRYLTLITGQITA
ncbi:MAG: NrfD/PsrC family molybdoenzyme membrane anchor subunit [Candidatus Bathyarchaeia archaeon]